VIGSKQLNRHAGDLRVAHYAGSGSGSISCAMPIFRQGPSAHQTSLAMIGAKAGDEVLVIGAGDAALAAEIARVTGLNGRLVVVDRAEGARARVEAAAGRAGALVEFEDAPPTMLPIDPDSYRIVVIANRLSSLAGSDRAGCCAEACRVLKPGGRLVVIDGARRPGIFGLFSQQSATIAEEEVLTLLARSGARAGRRLAAVDAVAYYEALKPRA
jgi:ubiquinone/menaquinone biosynthesis C-methylase UbiE